MRLLGVLRSRCHRLREGQGFSLTEVLMASVLLVVVLAAAYGIWFGLQRTYGFTEEDMKAQAEARAAMNEMVEVIRTAKEPDFPVSEALDLVIVRAEPNLLVCWSDIDRDDDHTLELVRFWVDSSTRTLYRDTCPSDSPDITFATGIQTRLVGVWVSNDQDDGNALFSYVGMNGAPLTYTEGTALNPMHIDDPTRIREIHLNLLVDVVIGKSPERHQLTSVVQPRNLRSY